MKFKSERKGCSTCKAMFRNDTGFCTRNNHGACIKSGNYDKWVDIYELCNGCQYQDNQVEDSSHCKNCSQIHLLGTENNYS